MHRFALLSAQKFRQRYSRFRWQLNLNILGVLSVHTSCNHSIHQTHKLTESSDLSVVNHAAKRIHVIRKHFFSKTVQNQESYIAHSGSCCT